MVLPLCSSSGGKIEVYPRQCRIDRGDQQPHVLLHALHHPAKHLNPIRSEYV